jgi:NTE family protein
MTEKKILRRRVALVIGSGSVKCAAALGLYKVLRREHIDLDMIVGCSGGSMYAAAIATGEEPDAIAKMIAKQWTREASSKRDRMAPLRLVMPKLFKFSAEFGMRDDEPVMRQLRAAYGDRRIEDSVIPLHITATDFMTGEQVVLSSGKVVDAVRASIAIPFIFKPWRVDGRLLVDGFVSDPLPVGVAIREGANVIVAIGFESPMQTNINTGARFAFQLSSIMTNNLLRASFAFHNLAHHSEVIGIVPQFKERIGLFDTAKIPYIMEEGERAAEEQVPYLRRLLSGEAAARATGA